MLNGTFCPFHKIWNGILIFESSKLNRAYCELIKNSTAELIKKYVKILQEEAICHGVVKGKSSTAM